MDTVLDVLRGKGMAVFTVRPTDSVLTALQVMAREGVGALMVTTDQGAIAGIVSERDYARKVELLGRTSADTTVADIMSTPVTTVSPSYSVMDCMHLMTARRIRHLPVLVDGQLSGLVSIGDVVKAIIDDQAFTIKQLETYISGDGP
jgi:CBS domain-containing protein